MSKELIMQTSFIRKMKFVSSALQDGKPIVEKYLWQMHAIAKFYGQEKYMYEHKQALFV